MLPQRRGELVGSSFCRLGIGRINGDDQLVGLREVFQKKRQPFNLPEMRREQAQDVHVEADPRQPARYVGQRSGRQQNPEKPTSAHR